VPEVISSLVDFASPQSTASSVLNDLAGLTMSFQPLTLDLDGLEFHLAANTKQSTKTFAARETSVVSLGESKDFPCTVNLLDEMHDLLLPSGDIFNSTTSGPLHADSQHKSVSLEEENSVTPPLISTTHHHKSPTDDPAERAFKIFSIGVKS
jgi:hypothetical protein